MSIEAELSASISKVVRRAKLSLSARSRSTRSSSIRASIWAVVSASATICWVSRSEARAAAVTAASVLSASSVSWRRIEASTARRNASPAASSIARSAWGTIADSVSRAWLAAALEVSRTLSSASTSCGAALSAKRRVVLIVSSTIALSCSA
jgi:hypothetical protein